MTRRAPRGVSVPLDRRAAFPRNRHRALDRLDRQPPIPLHPLGQAEVILAELGPDMSRFPSHGHAASWAAISQGNDDSAGKRKTGKTRKGDRWLRAALVEAANGAAGRTKDTYLRAQYLRVKRRDGHKKAIVAVAHSILVAAYYILSEQKPYQDLGGHYFIRREDQERIIRRLVRQLERLGQRVALEPALEAR